MTDLLGDIIQIRDRNVITLPVEVRRFLGVSVGDWIRFEVYEGNVCVHRIVPHRSPKNSCGGVDDRNGKTG